MPFWTRRVAPLVALGIAAALVAEGLLAHVGARADATPLVTTTTTPPPTTTTTPPPTTTTTTPPTTTTTTPPTTTTTRLVTTTTTTTTTTTSRPAPEPHGRIETLELPSGDASGGPRTARVYRPGVPDTADLPVLYFLHGLPGSDRNFEDAGLTGFLDADVAAGGKPFVVVVPDGNSALRTDTEWADAGDGEIRLETFLVSTLISAVEGDMPRDRRRRAIGGFSMGGYGAMNVALHHPDLFAQVVTISGYFHSDDPDGMAAGQPSWAADNSPDQHVAQGSALRMLLVAASNEPDPLIAGEAQRFARLAEDAGQHPTLQVVPGAHDWSLVVGVFPQVAEFLRAGW